MADPWIVLVIIIAGSIFAALIPPFQSPDEFDHLKRAYLLSRGQIILDAPGGQSSGGLVDTGLLAFMAAYQTLPFVAERKLSAAEIEAARAIRWTGIREFSPAPGTGYYFPLIYLPQAVGLALGEALRLPVATSYRMARVAALSVLAILLFVSFKIYSTNPFAVALLIVPMSVFQFSSASLDGVSTGLAVLAVSAFLRCAEERSNVGAPLLLALTLAVALLSSSRIHLLPMLALPLAACFLAGNRRHLMVAGFTTTLVFAWLFIAAKTTVDTRVPIGAPITTIILYYLRQPLAFLQVLGATLSNPDALLFYRNSFLGVLGWLDTPFREEEYRWLFLLISLIAALSISLRNIRATWVPRLVIICTAFISILLVFFLLLVSWTPHPASEIQGVQGRYFLVPLIMIAYALSGDLLFHEGKRRKIALVLLFALGATTVFGMPPLLLDRYFVQPALAGSTAQL